LSDDVWAVVLHHFILTSQSHYADYSIIEKILHKQQWLVEVGANNKLSTKPLERRLQKYVSCTIACRLCDIPDRFPSDPDHNFESAAEHREEQNWKQPSVYLPIVTMDRSKQNILNFQHAIKHTNMENIR
jgi:hypothetical protein